MSKSVQLEFDFIKSGDAHLHLKELTLVNLHAYEKDLTAQLDYFTHDLEEDPRVILSTLQNNMLALNAELLRRYAGQGIVLT